jgi:SSS family solute:Na+ symporter
VFWKRASAAGAIITLWSGFVLGFAVFLLDWFKEYTGWSVPSMMTTFYLFVICMAIMIAVSIVKPHRHTPESEALVWGNPLDALRGPWGGLTDFRLLAAVLLGVIVTLYAVFA